MDWNSLTKMLENEADSLHTGNQATDISTPRQLDEARGGQTMLDAIEKWIANQVLDPAAKVVSKAVRGSYDVKRVISGSRRAHGEGTLSGDTPVDWTIDAHYDFKRRLVTVDLRILPVGKPRIDRHWNLNVNDDPRKVANDVEKIIGHRR